MVLPRVVAGTLGTGSHLASPSWSSPGPGPGKPCTEETSSPNYALEKKKTSPKCISTERPAKRAVAPFESWENLNTESLICPPLPPSQKAAEQTSLAGSDVGWVHTVQRLAGTASVLWTRGGEVFGMAAF